MLIESIVCNVIQKKKDSDVYTYYKTLSNRRRPNCDMFIMFISRYLFTEKIHSNGGPSFSNCFALSNVVYTATICNDHFLFFTPGYCTYTRQPRKRLLTRAIFYQDIDTIVTSSDRVIFGRVYSKRTKRNDSFEFFIKNVQF